MVPFECPRAPRQRIGIRLWHLEKDLICLLFPLHRMLTLLFSLFQSQPSPSLLLSQCRRSEHMINWLAPPCHTRRRLTMCQKLRNCWHLICADRSGPVDECHMTSIGLPIELSSKIQNRRQVQIEPTWSACVSLGFFLYGFIQTGGIGWMTRVRLVNKECMMTEQVRSILYISYD